MPVQYIMRKVPIFPFVIGLEMVISSFSCLLRGNTETITENPAGSLSHAWAVLFLSLHLLAAEFTLSRSRAGLDNIHKTSRFPMCPYRF